MNIKKLNRKRVEINDVDVVNLSNLDAEIKRINVAYLNDALGDIGFTVSFDGINAVSENYIEDEYSLLLSNSEILNGMIDAAISYGEGRPEKLKYLLTRAIAEINKISNL
tara:strand:- start:239 stop:568 length:330 start_codon:yes stop_codon:yes gene_type:complete